MVPIILKVFFSVLTLIVAWALLNFTVKSVSAAFKRMGKELGSPRTFKVLVGVVYYLTAIFVILGIWNVNLGPLLAGAGFSGIVVGIAFQEPLSNFASGLLLIFTRTLREGDAVQVGDTSGSVEVIHVNHTLIKTWDGKRVLIPNRLVWNREIIHFWPDAVRRREMVIGIPYDSDLEKVMNLLKQSLEEEMLIEKDPEPAIIFDRFADSSVNFIIRFWVKRENYFSAGNSFAIRVKKKLEENGIYIPFPQLDVYIKEIPKNTEKG